MKARSQNLKSKSKLNIPFSFLKKYYLFLIFVGCVGFVGVISIYRLFVMKPTYVYVKVKVGQGMWWASTQRPSLWFVKAIQQAKEQKDLTGTPLATMVNISYYPYYGTGQYDTYATLRLKVSKMGSTGNYSFNRETIGVSSPIDLEFPNVQFSGTIIELSTQPIIESYVEKTIFLTKKYSYPWEYDVIQIGDSISNGKDTVLQIVDKAKGDTNEVFLNDQGKLTSTEVESYRYIVIQAKIKVKKAGNQLLYGEETVVSPGRTFGIITDGVTLSDYVIAKVQ